MALACWILLAACAADEERQARLEAADLARCERLVYQVGTPDMSACRQRLREARGRELDTAARELELRDFKHSWP